MMKNLFEQLKTQLGLQGISGIVLLILTGLFSVLALDPLEQETTFLHGRLDEARSKASMQTRTFSLADRQKELGLFFDSLPAEAELTDVLAKIYAIAEASGIGFKQAEYQMENKDRPRVEYKITFPVQGDYGQVRYFVSRVLVENPAISLDQINFQRDRINNPALKAEIRMTLFLRPDVVR